MLFETTRKQWRFCFLGGYLAVFGLVDGGTNFATSDEEEMTEKLSCFENKRLIKLEI
jgi:hypothetical protein